MTDVANQNLDQINALIGQKISVDSLNPDAYIELLDIMPNPRLGIMPELAIVAAARTSFLGESTRIEKDQRLYNYLHKHHHSSPSEMSEILFRIVSVDDIFVRELITDQRWKVHSLRGFGTIIKIDLNNLIQYLTYTENSHLQENPIKQFLKKVIQVAYPWMAAILGYEEENQVSYAIQPNIERRMMEDGFGDRWVELHECNCSDQILSNLIREFMPMAAELDTGEAIQYMFDQNDLRPLSMFSVKMALRAPVLVLWQLVRHRSINANFQSGRYMAFSDDDYYVPDNWRKQSESNKQGSSDEILDSKDFSQVILKLLQDSGPALRDIAEAAVSLHRVGKDTMVEFNALLQEYYDTGYTIYKAMLDQGAAKEQARMFLPAWASLYTTVIKFDLMFFMRFLRLRTAPDAQAEIREYANVMFDLFQEMMPITANIAAEHKFLGS